MNITVCVKQVPSTETKIRINTQTGFVDTGEIEWVVNPYDEYALETALRLKEKAGAGTITVIALGPERVKIALRTALAMGADSALQLTTRVRWHRRPGNRASPRRGASGSRMTLFFAANRPWMTTRLQCRPPSPTSSDSARLGCCRIDGGL